MKYFKLSVVFFVTAFVLSSLGVNASEYVLSGVKIPTFSGIWRSSDQSKFDFSEQKIKKTSCTDNLSGDGRVVLGAIYRRDNYLTNGVLGTDWIEVGYSYSTWGSKCNTPMPLKLGLKSKKSLPTTATFDGSWVIDP